MEYDMMMETAQKKVQLQHVLYATDFSRQAEQALPFVVSIARKYGSIVIAAHVHSYAPLAGLPRNVELQSLEAQALKEAREKLLAIEPLLKGIPHEFLVRSGDIWAELSSIIEARKIDLIAVGTHGRTGASKLLMGSVAEQIFRQATCPVLTVGPNVSAEPGSVADIHTILFPTDFSSESQSTLPFAISLAEENQARLYLLHVEPDLVPGSMEDALRERTRAMVPLETKLWCRPKVFVESGDPAEVILNLADELGIDLIVLGTKHVSRFAGTRTHLGMATASKIVSHALCPVLSLRG